MKFKKSLAALLAAIMVIGTTSCSLTDKDKDEDDEDEVTSSAAADDKESKADDEESKADEESAADESTADESTADESTADESVADESEPDVEVETGYADGVFTGEYYNITVDESLWEYTEQAATDCAFMYIGGEADSETATANLNVVSMSSSLLGGMDVSEYADSIEEAYASMDGYDIVESGTGKLGDYDTYNVSVAYAIGEYTMTIKQIILSNDEGMVAISYGAFDSVMDEMQPMFDDVINSFKFN